MIDIYITRQTGSSIQCGGLNRIDVWFVEPCLKVRLTHNDCPFEESHPDYDPNIKESLKGILYFPNTITNFLFRQDNTPENHKLPFGDKLVANVLGTDFPQILIDYEKENKVIFEWDVFGGGSKVGYRPNSARNLFGYPEDNKASEVSSKIWELVCEEFENAPFLEWNKIEERKPWWRFCKKLSIDIKLV